ncbi:HAD family hydrolase [Frondihabitans australicus]|uniref:Putative hydrolase of the HAD superfamily n=1 Tax=Frondihabitans australicus TaxID=386892 RepID=A0A495IJX1_9MICO|nr:HAD family hydrolase [Frondihabitans australicus]RKR75415.1 putative hydrolase of the HAD superfamily [Frondihabitans australicus]
MAPLLLLDLDNTLIDRDAAFEAWVRHVAEGAGAPVSAVDEVLAVDDSGYGDRDDVAEAMRRLLRLEDDPETLVDRIRHEHVELVALAEGVRERIEAIADRGVHLGVVTNGPVRQQTMKLRRVGLSGLVDRAMISEGAGVAKPDPEIFRRAMERAGATPDDTWMVGDSARADIRGAQDAGLRTGWVSLGRGWPGGEPPTVQAPTTAEVLDLTRL